MKPVLIKIIHKVFVAILHGSRPGSERFVEDSVTAHSVGSQMAAAGNVDAANVVHVASSGRSLTDAVICN